MDPVAQLLGLFILLYALEGALFVRRSAVIFVGSGRFRPRTAQRSPVGTQSSALLFLSPLPPLEVGLVTEPEPLTFGAEGVVPISSSRAGEGDRPAEALRPIDEGRCRSAVAEGKNVRDGEGALITPTSSPAAARALAEDLRAFAAASPETRADLVQARVVRRYDANAARERRKEMDRELATLGLLGPATWALAFFTLYGVFHIPFVWARWPWFTLAVVALLLHLLLEIWSAHRRLYGGLVLDRIMKLVLVLFSVPAAARARALVARDALATFAPPAAAAALLDGPAFEAWVAPVWRDLQHPTGPEPEACASVLEAARAAELDALRPLLAAAGVAPSTLERPPARDGASVTYCPRCHAQYVAGDEACEDCPGVRKIAFGAAETS